MSENQYKALQVEALVVDDTVAGRDSFRRWKFDYRRMEDYLSPEPVPFGNNQNVKERGIWLRWVLPRELRTQQENGSFPLIPNRYLIERFGKKTGERKIWILECDCPLSDALGDEQYERVMPYTAQYLVEEAVVRSMKASGDPYRESVYARPAQSGSGWYVNLGVPFEGEEWEERGESLPFLTACPPGNPDFSGYVHHNCGVLSFFDNLRGHKEDCFHYSVIGWHSNGGQDYYSGQVFSVLWRQEGWFYKDGEDPYHDELGKETRNGKINVAIGENGAEAFRAWFVRMFLMGKNDSAEEENHLEWLLCALMEGKENAFTEEDGGLKLREQLHRGRFEEQYGGTRDTADLDKEIEILHSLQKNLQTVWWKRGYVSKFKNGVNGKRKEDYDAYFNIEDKDSLLSRTAAQYEKVKKLWERRREQPDNKALGRYWKPADPYLIIYGIKEPLDTEELGQGRGDADLYTGMEESVPRIKGELPEGVKKLYQETCAFIAEYDNGQIPEKAHPGYPIEAWHQPWRPAFMEWRVGYEELDGFWFDGFDYTIDLMGRPDRIREGSFGGRITLDSGRREQFAKLLESLEEQVGDKVLQEAAASVKGWDLMGQSLSGFTEQMAQRDTRAFVRPSGEAVPGTGYLLTEIMGYEDADAGFYERVGGAVESVPCVQDNIIPKFRIAQGGRGSLRDLVLYDAFGRELVLVASQDESGCYSSDNFPLIVSGEMRGISEETHHGFLIKPALLQESRLSVSLVGEQKGKFLCFLVLDYLGHSLLVFSPEGEALGELVPLASECGERKVAFFCFPNTGYEEERIKKDYPLLWNFIEVQVSRSVQAFEEMLDKIDSTFWMMEAAGANKEERLALLRGRPLALSQMPVYIERYGLERADAGWSGGGEEKFRGIQFPFRIGEASMRCDGVVGYFENEAFQDFHSSYEKGRYLKTGFDKETAATPYVLYDPLLSIHIYTGILPVKRISCEKKEVLEMLGKIKVQFPVGPVARKEEQGGRVTVREGYLTFESREESETGKVGGIWNE